jgi:hypothetical protein
MKNAEKCHMPKVMPANSAWPYAQEYTLVASLAEQDIQGGSATFKLDVSNSKIQFGYGSGAPELVVEVRAGGLCSPRHHPYSRPSLLALNCSL